MKKTLLKEAGAILILAVLVLSSTAVFGQTEDTSDATVLTEIAEATSTVINNEHASGKGPELWNNGAPDGRNGLSCVYWPSSPLDRYVKHEFSVSEGGWEIRDGHLNIVTYQGYGPEILDGVKLQKGDKNNRVLALRRRLETCGEIKPKSSQNDTIFDENLELAVKSFQDRFGLDVDGIVGKGTIAELNIPASQRVDQLRVNLERWRWLPQNLGTRYILVNIANFELKVVENGELIETMRVVVGRPYRRTPVFSDMMTYLVFNPHWNVPPTITNNDVLPEVRKNVDYLTQKNMKVFLGWGADAKEIDPKTVDWSTITTSNNPYRFRQEPGPANALGKIKFMSKFETIGKHRIYHLSLLLWIHCYYIIFIILFLNQFEKLIVQKC